VSRVLRHEQENVEGRRRGRALPEPNDGPIRSLGNHVTPIARGAKPPTPIGPLILEGAKS